MINYVKFDVNSEFPNFLIHTKTTARSSPIIALIHEISSDFVYSICCMQISEKIFKAVEFFKKKDLWGRRKTKEYKLKRKVNLVGLDSVHTRNIRYQTIISIEFYYIAKHK